MRHLVCGNVIRFLIIFKDSHVWLQITLRNQMLGEFEFPLNPISVGIWVPFKISRYPDSQT